MIISARDTNDFLVDKLYEYMVIIGKMVIKKTGTIQFLSFCYVLVFVIQSSSSHTRNNGHDCNESNQIICTGAGLVLSADEELSTSSLESVRI